MATVFAVGGFLGSGKTTFARRLEVETGAVRLSLDEWLIGLSSDRVHLDPEVLERVSRLLNDLWPRIAHAGADVILDMAFWRRSAREDARGRAAAVGADFKFYWLVCDDETAIERCAQRYEADGYEIDEATYWQLRERLGPLGSDEAAEVIRTT